MVVSGTARRLGRECRRRQLSAFEGESDKHTNRITETGRDLNLPVSSFAERFWMRSGSRMGRGKKKKAQTFADDSF